MKKIIFIALLLFTVHCSLLTATAQSRTNRLTRPCPGSTTPATVSIAVGGNISVTPCSGGTVTINGTVVPQGVKVYRALLQQSGTSAPTVTVLENSLGGTLVWTRTGVGTYEATLAGAFPTVSKVFINVSAVNNANDQNVVPLFYRSSVNVISFLTYVLPDALGDFAIAGSQYLPVEILVYP